MAKKKAGAMSKLAMVRQILGELGKDTMPAAIQEHLKSKFGVQMSTAMVSNYKSTILKKGKRKKGRKAKAAPAEAPVAVANGKGISVADIVAIKELAQKIGPSRFRELAYILA